MRFAVTAVLALAAAACAHHSSEDTSVSASTISASTPAIPASRYAAAGMQRTRKRRGAQHSTDDLLACAALDAGPTQLKDVSAADVARRSSASHLGDINVETDQERRAKHKACKEIPRPAAALVETPGTPTELEGFLGSREQAHRGIRAGRRSSGSGSGAPYSPVGEIASVGMPHPKPKKSKSKHRTKSKSSATSSTLASPSPSFPSFPHGVRDSGVGGAEEDFDGTRGVFDSTIGVKAEPEVVRGLPSPGLVRGAGGVPARCWWRLGEGDRWCNSSLGWPWVRQPSDSDVGEALKAWAIRRSAAAGGRVEMPSSITAHVGSCRPKRPNAATNEHDWFGLTQIYVSWLRSQETKCWVGFWVLDKETDKAVRNEETSPNLTHNYSNFCLVLSTR
ncbi:hypothetical protein B0H14DRAFT_3754346 [Mycena olivaceomarginata]|nr:hypothetical protein B0H14DRAFT_3754346 [Mycena olivaceomarginata]